MEKAINLPEDMKLTLQTVLADSSQDTLKEFERLLARMEKLGMYGLELNLPQLSETIQPRQLKELLEAHHLVLTYVASGVYAANHGMALAASEEKVRLASIEGCLENMRYAAEMDCGCGVIIGTLKGTPGLAVKDGAQERLIMALKEVFCRARSEGLEVPVLLEVTNHYESSVANTLAEAREILGAVGEPGLYLLPDLYHMNIEEKDGFQQVSESLPYLRNIHLSDNNRYFPGYGAIDFSRWYRFLHSLGYRGTYGIEGRSRNGLMEDLEESVYFLRDVL